MPPNALGPGVSRYLNDRDRQFAAVVFETNRPLLDSEFNLISLTNLESQAEAIRARYPSGWVMDESNPYEDYTTDPNNSNLFFFGRNASNEVRNLTWAIVNGWLIPVTGTQTGAPPLAPNNTDTWNKILLNIPPAGAGGNQPEFVFLEVWLARIDVDPAPPTIAPGKPARGYIWRFGNVEGGFDFLPDQLVDPDINFETTKRVQIQYRIRVVQNVGLATYPEGFDPALVFAQGALAAPSVVPFTNMRGELGDSGLWRAGTGDYNTFGTVDGYVYAIPICSAFRRNSVAFSDTNLAGSFNRNMTALLRTDATTYTNSIVLPAGGLTDVAVSFNLTSITGTVLSTWNAFGGETYFKIDDEIVRVSNIIVLGPANFQINIDRAQLSTVARAHLAGVTLVEYTVRPDGLYADQVAISDILDMRHGVGDKFDYEALLKTNFLELLKGNLKTAWKRNGATNIEGPIVIYGDCITDSSITQITELDGPNGNRRVFSDCAVTERYVVPVQVPSNAVVALPSPIPNILAAPYKTTVNWTTAAPGHAPGTRLLGGVNPPVWWNGDVITILKSDFEAGGIDPDQVRFVLPSEDPDAVLIHFEGMTTDPNGGSGSPPVASTDPTVTNPTLTTLAPTGLPILKNGQGITVAIDGSGNLTITFNSGIAGTALQEFLDALQSSVVPAYAAQILMHVEFAVVIGTGRGLSHKPDYIHIARYAGDPLKVMLRSNLTGGGLGSGNRMIPTYLCDSPYVQTGVNRNLARTSEVMIDPGSKTVYAAPYRSILLPPLMARSGVNLNWYYPGPVAQGAMPKRDQIGTWPEIHPVVDPLVLFNWGAGTVYVEIPLEYLPKPGLHHIPIMSVTTPAGFPSGLNFLLMSQEGPFAGNLSKWNRNIVSYPVGMPGYYIVTPIGAEVYGANAGGAGVSIFGQKYSNSNLRAQNGGPFKGIQFPPFLAPARITGVYKRVGVVVTPAASPFDVDRHFVGGAGTDVNLLRDDFDGPTVLLDVDSNGDLTFILNADAIDLTKSTPGDTWINTEFLVECTLFAFDRGFLQTNGRILTVTAGFPIIADAFTDATDNLVGIIAPAPLTLNSVNNELTVFYSRAPYQGDVFGSQNAFSDDPQRVGPLTVGEQNSIHSSPLGPVNTLSFINPAGFEVLAAFNFATDLGTGRMSGSNPIPLLNTTEAPLNPPDYTGTLVDLWRRFSLNRVGYDDWATPKFPAVNTSFAARPAIVRGALDEVYDRDIHTEFAGCTTQLPMGIYFRDKDFIGKLLYQTRSASNAAITPVGTLTITPFESAQNPTAPGNSTWEGTEFICGNSSNTSGAGGESIIKVDGTPNFASVTQFKTTRGAAAFSASKPWPGGAISAAITKAKPNTEVGSLLSGTVYLVRSQPESVNGIEVHAGAELQLLVVTQGVPSYFRDNNVLHSANGTGDGFSAVDRFRIWGRPLEKTRDLVDLTLRPTDKPLFVNDIYDNPLYFGSSSLPLSAQKQEVLPVKFNGQTQFFVSAIPPEGLSARPADPTTVQLFCRGIKLTYSVDYVVSGTTNQNVTYIVSGSNPPLLTTDTLEVFYNML